MKQFNILILDDDIDYLHLASHWEKSIPNHFKLHLTYSIEEAESILSKGGIDALIVDNEMPTIHGSQFGMLVKRKYPKLITALVSGVDEEFLRADAVAHNFDLYFSKGDKAYFLSMLDNVALAIQ